jgi:hypothetical protein
MMQDRTILTLGFWSLGMTLGLVTACAGGDTPARDSDLEDRIANMYAGGQTASVGGSTGTGGTAGTGLGGSAAQGTGGGTAGGAGSASMAAGGASGGCDGYAILKSKCSGAPCHDQQSSGPGVVSNFVLDQMTAKGFADEPSATCGSSDNAPIFDPENPAASLVVKKITATSSCGGRMPLGASTQQLTDAELTCVKDWIGTL